MYLWFWYNLQGNLDLRRENYRKAELFWVVQKSQKSQTQKITKKFMRKTSCHFKKSFV